MNVHISNRYHKIIDEIGNFNWRGLERDELLTACRAYYYFSRQFVEAVHTACDLYPSDQNLISLREGECDTDNLSPYPGIAEKGEKMNHDEFMRRVVEFCKLGSGRARASRQPRPRISRGSQPHGSVDSGNGLVELRGWRAGGRVSCNADSARLE